MSLHQNKQTGSHEAQPDRLAFALLIIGVLTVCQVVLYRIISYIVGVWRQPYILPLIFLGGVGMVYGSIRIVRGGSVTQQFVKATLIEMGNGAIAGTAMAFVVLQMARVSANHESWSNWFSGVIPSLMVDIPGALFFGIAPGGISGWILGNIWKDHRAAFVGGASAGLVSSFLYILFYFWCLQGGC